MLLENVMLTMIYQKQKNPIKNRKIHMDLKVHSEVSKVGKECTAK